MPNSSYADAAAFREAAAKGQVGIDPDAAQAVLTNIRTGKDAIANNSDRRLARDVGTAASWYGRQLVPLYHPGPRAVARRSFAQHAADYAALAVLVEPRPTRRRRTADR